MACQQGVGFAHPAAASPAKGLRHGHLSCPTWPVGHPARPGAPIPREIHPRCPLPSSASPPRPRHGKSPRHCLRAFVLSQRLHLVSIVCDVSVGRRRGLSGACYSACMTQTRRPSTGRESFLPLYLTLFVVYLVGVGLPLGQEQFSSSRAIPGVFRIAAATCGGFLPRNRVETDKECRHVGRRR